MENRSKFNWGLMKSISGITLIRMFGVLVVLLYQGLISKTFGASGLGFVLLSWMLVSIVSVIACLGLEIVVLRLSASLSHEQERRNWIIRRSLLIGLVSGFLFSAILWLSATMIAETIFHKPEVAPILREMSPSVLIFSLVLIMSGALNGLGKTSLAVAMQSLIPLALASVLFLVLPEDWGIVRITVGFVMGWVITFLIGIITLTHLGVLRRINSSQYSAADLIDGAKHLFLFQLINQLVLWLPVLVAGIFLTAEEVGVLGAALRIGVAVSFLLLSTSLVLAPRYAVLYKNNELKKMEDLAKTSSRVMVLVSIPIFLFLVLQGDLLLGFLGDSFVNGYIILLIISAGQLVNTFSGSVGYLLNMSGHEASMKNSALINFLFSLPMAFILTSMYGIYGIAISTAISVMLVNVLMVITLKRKLGISSLPI